MKMCGRALVVRNEGPDTTFSRPNCDKLSMLAVFARVGRLVVREPPGVGAARVFNLLWTLPLGGRLSGLCGLRRPLRAAVGRGRAAARACAAEAQLTPVVPALALGDFNEEARGHETPGGHRNSWLGRPLPNSRATRPMRRSDWALSSRAAV